MRVKALTAVAAVLLFGATLSLVAATPARPDTRGVAESIGGVWKAPTYRVEANSELDREVWGSPAFRVRRVSLTMEKSGEGVMTLYTAVEDARGRAKRFSASVVEVRIAVADPPASAPRPEMLPVTVSSAEERYLDDTGEKRPLPGVKIALFTVASDPNRLNFRYDTPGGTGSFGESLERQVPRVSRR